MSVHKNNQNFIGNSPYCRPYNSCDVSLENLELDKLIVPLLIFFFILMTGLLVIVLILLGEILSRSLVGLKGLNGGFHYTVIIKMFLCFHM